ncbi:FYN-binding protein 1 isoform 2-T2 [Odontesthes bonariensis]|uniref:FYN-binding protein 1 isoform X2 n=1 Tax=Odontesthes bonariensis TaxID=219752 RepID=UPI003F58A71E
MENKADVRAIMARFQTSGASMDETSSTAGGRTKQPLNPTTSTGPAVQKKPVLESISGGAINTPPKPSFLKNTPSTKSDTDVHEPNKAKALASRFANINDGSNISNKPVFVNKQRPPLKPNLSTASEAKGPVQKPLFNKPPLTATLSDSKPAFPKPLNSRPSWVKEDSGGGTALNPSSAPPKTPSLQQKPSSNILRLMQQNEEQSGANTDSANKPPPVVNAAFKPTSNFRTAHTMFNKEKDTAEQTDNGGVNKLPLTATNSITPPPKPPNSKKPSLKKPSKVSPQASSINGDATSGPKRNPLPNSLALGPAPAKPNRPPKVDLENIKRGAEAPEDVPGFRKPIIPTPPTSHPSNHGSHVTPAAPSQAMLPSLPPRHPGFMNQQDVYDDVDEPSSAPPPLPPSTGHPSQRAKEESDDEGDMYEPLDERWDEAEKSQEKKKDDKEEKKRLEAEKKEQKEREKKEQDARKKFKLVGPLQVIQQGKARGDCKGSKTDLALKQGDSLDIIRVQGNPEGKWLGRTQDGSIGYVKTTSVEIDFNSLKISHTQGAYDPEVYDDIDVAQPDNSAMKGPGVVLPPLPGEEGEIYDDVLDPNLEVRVPPPSQFNANGNSDQPGAAIDEEIYDDVDAQNAPPPPPLSSLPGMRGKSKTDDMDPKKQKKFEKEEKDFRKKFKYEGEIQVLYQVTIVPSLTNKKWSGKELPVKAGEKLDVMVKAVDDKLICRNEDGKFGYVSTSHIVMDDGEIYDDIGGDDCIYDND